MVFVSWIFVLALIGLAACWIKYRQTPYGQEVKSDSSVIKLSIALIIIICLCLLIALVSGGLDFGGGCPAGGYYDIC